MADTTQINDIFERNQNLMLPEVLSRLPGRNMLVDIFDKGTWPGAMGDIIDTLTIERSFADGASEEGDDWGKVYPDSLPADTINTLPPEQTLTTGATRRQMQVFWKALESERINLELIRGGHQLGNQLDITENQFVSGVTRELEKRMIYAYLHTSNNLVNASFVDDLATIRTGAQGFSTGHLPDMELEQGFLDRIWDEMENETQGDGAVGKDEANANVYLLLTEPLTSRGLRTNNAAIRQDQNYAYQGSKMESPLLQPYGMGGKCYGNFVHKTYKQMPRYDYTAGPGLVRRPYWLKVAASTIPGTRAQKGYAWVPNPARESAEFTTSFIINLKVFKWLVPGMLDAPGGGTAFETPNYFPKGIQWLNERNLDKDSKAYNPDKTIGRYRAVMAAAIQPLFPSYGWCILHRKHQPPIGSTYTAGQYGS